MREMTRRLWMLMVLAALSGSAHATFHLWAITQVFSNADGSVQYVVLRALSNGQQYVHGHTIKASQGSTTHTFTIPTDLPGDTADMGEYGYYGMMGMTTYKSMLIATQGFAALGVVTPDYTVPNGFFFLTNGTIDWGEGADMMSYASLPTDGTHALAREGTIVNSAPLNFMGDTGVLTLASTPGALTGLWWNEHESGWGIHFTQRGSNVFTAWYTYDAAGNPKWYAANCAMPAGTTGTTGTCNGAILEVSGPTFFGTTFDPTLVHSVSAGNLQVSFQGPNNGSMTYSGVAGQTRTIAITRTPLAAGTTPPAVNYTDIWWAGPSESGWGMAITQQFNVMFLAWYVYDSNGKPTWYSAICSPNAATWSGQLLRTTGPGFGPTFDSSLVHNAPAGTVSVTFTDPNNAMLNYNVNGVSASKAITRSLF